MICYYFDPMIEPLETLELLAFTKTIEAKSLSRAAAELATPRATIGRRLARLEDRLGVRLVQRTTRALALTDAGEAFYRHAKAVLDAVTQAEESVRTTDAAIRGSLRVTVPPMADPGLNALICEFARTYPGVQLQVNASARYVDLLREGYDVALRASIELEPGLVARTLMRASVVAVASPAYLAARGTPKTARDLRGHECLRGFVRGELPQTHWPRVGGGKIHVEGSFASNDILLLADAAVRGVGIAMLPMIVVSAHLRSGALVQVLPDVIRVETRIAVVYAERQFLPPQVRAFIDAIVAWAPNGLNTTRAAEQRLEWPSRTKATTKKLKIKPTAKNGRA